MGLLKELDAWALDRHPAAASAWHPAQLSVSVTTSPVTAPASSVRAGESGGAGRGRRAVGGADGAAMTVGAVMVSGVRESGPAQASARPAAARTASKTKRDPRTAPYPRRRRRRA